MTDITDNSKVSNLWKKSRGVVDVDKNATFEKLSQKEYINQVLNEEIFSSDVPNRIPGNLASWTNAPQPTQSEYSVENLDLSSNSNFTPGQTVNLGIIGHPELTYYHRWRFEPHPTANALQSKFTATTWYIPDTSFSNNQLYSIARNTISFKKGGQGDYQYVFYIDAQNGPRKVAELETPYKFVFDNQSGYILIYADDDSAGNWKISSTQTATTGPILASFIKYTGAKGAAADGDGSFQDGLDASFNNVDISNNLNIVHDDLETGILQSSSFIITPPVSGLGRGLNEWLIAKVQYDNITDVNATGYFTLEVNELTNPNSYLKCNFIAGVITLETTTTDIEFNAFVKVLSCIRRSDGTSPDPGIVKINIHKGGVNFPNSVLLTLTHDTNVNLGPVKIRLYKNSLNKIDTYNELQWTLVSQDLSIGFNSSTEIVSSWIGDKADPPETQTIGGNPLLGSPGTTVLVRPPLYPLHPKEPFTTTTQFTIIDNALNVQKDFNLKGNINLMESGGGSQGGVKRSPKILAPVLDLYEHKLFTDADFGSDNNITNFSTGVWQTIATVEATPNGSANLDQRNAYAMFEIVDRSNAGTVYKFTDTLSFIVNFSAFSGGSANASINLLSSNPTGNTTVYYGYIKGIRARCGQHSASIAGSSQGGVNIQLLRTSDAAANGGSTNIRVNMYHNYKTLNTKKEINPFVLKSTGLNLTSNVRSAEIDLTTYDHGFASTFSLGMTSNFENATFYKITQAGTGGATRPINQIPTGIVMRGDLDMSTYYINNLNYLKMNGNLDMNTLGNNAIININSLTGGTSNSAYPKITFTTNDTEIFVSHGSNGKIKIGSGTDTAQQISMNTGAEINLDMNNIEIENTDLISKIIPTHKEKTNRAYLQEFSFNTNSLPLSYKSDNHSPAWGFGGVAGDEDWITIAVSGRFTKDPTTNQVSIGDGSNRWRVDSKGYFRAHALFELIDMTSGHHHSVKFYAGFKFGKPSIRVLSNNTYSKVRFNKLRIKYGAGTVSGSYVKNTYTGCVLQFQLRDSDSNGNGAASKADIQLKVWQNTENAGWKISTESVIVKENNPRCYVKTSVALEYRKFDTMPVPAPIYSGPTSGGGDGNYIPVGGSPYQNELVIDTSRDLVLDTNNIYKGETIITDKLNAKDASSFVKLANTGEGIKIYGDAGTEDGLLAQSSNNGSNENVLTINPNANEYSTFEVKLKHGPSGNRQTTSGLSINRDYIRLKVPLHLSTTSADILSGSLTDAEFGKLSTLGGMGLEVAASDTIGDNVSGQEGGELPVIRTKEPYKLNNLFVFKNRVMVSETCYNLISRYGLTDMFMDGPATSDPQSNNRRRFHGGDNAVISSGTTKYYRVGLIQSFKGEDLNKDSTSSEAGEWETPFRGRGWFTGCAFGWPQKSAIAGPLQVKGNAKFKLIVNGKTVIEWTSSNPNSIYGSERTYNFSNVVLDLPSEDWVWCGNELVQDLGSYYPNDNVYNSNLKFTNDGNSLIHFEMEFPGGGSNSSRRDNNWIELPDDDNMNGRSPGTDSSLIRMNAFFASYPKLK